jgi:hypothetical protein
VHALLQHICIRVPDKADYRHSASTAIQTILAELPKDQHGRFIVFADKYVKNQKVNYRLFGVELAIELLRHKNNISATAAKAEDSVISAESMRVLLAVLQQRAVDKVNGFFFPPLLFARTHLIFIVFLLRSPLTSAQRPFHRWPMSSKCV